MTIDDHPAGGAQRKAEWRALVAGLRDRLGMYIGHHDYGKAWALLVGFDMGVGGETLWWFRRWLTARCPEQPNLAFNGQVVLCTLGFEAVGRELTPEENEAALEGLFGLLSEFLDDDDFERRWVEADRHLRDAFAAINPEHRHWVAPHLDDRDLIPAFQWFVRSVEQTGPAPPPELIDALRRAAAVLGQEDDPNWKRAEARLADA